MIGIGLITVVMIFSIPIIAIVTEHSRKKVKLQQEIIKDQIELERLKQENFMIETEKLRLELDKMEHDHTNRITKL